MGFLDIFEKAVHVIKNFDVNILPGLDGTRFLHVLETNQGSWQIVPSPIVKVFRSLANVVSHAVPGVGKTVLVRMYFKSTELIILTKYRPRF